MTQRLLHLRQRGFAIECMAGMGVSEPVARERWVDACAQGCGFEHVVDATLSQAAAGALGAEDWIGGPSLAPVGWSLSIFSTSGSLSTSENATKNMGLRSKRTRGPSPLQLVDRVSERGRNSR